MRFLNPIAVTCLTCGQPTVVVETSIGSVRVHCGTWHWKCDIPATDTSHTGSHATTPTGATPLDAAADQELAA